MPPSSKKPSSPVQEKSTKSVTPRFFAITNLISMTTITLVAFIVLWRVTKNGFTDWDDDLYVTEAHMIRNLDWPSIKLFFTTLTANLYTPLVTMSYAIDFKLYGLTASGFHATNLIIHGVNVILVYAFTFLSFRKPFLAGSTALVFSIHPLNVEAVAWVSSRKDLLFSMFYLAGLITYLLYLDRKKKQLLVAVFVFFILAIFSKPVALTFPVVLLVIDYFRNKRISKADILEKIPFFAVSIVFGVLGVYLVREYQVFATAPVGYNFFDKVCLAGYSLAFYLYNAIFPSGISNYHAYPFKEGDMLDAAFLAAPLIVLITLFFLYKFIRKDFGLITGLIMFLLIIGPTLRLVPTGYPIAADRYFYLASVGLFWTIILGLQRVALISFPLRYAVLVCSLIGVIICCVTSFRRVSDWKDSYSLWKSALKEDPYHEMANEHLGKLYDNAGDKTNALIHFQRVIDRNKTNPDVLNSVGNILIDKDQADLAMKYFEMAIATGKANQLPYYNRGMVYSSKNKFDKAIKDFDEALTRNPSFAEAFNNRGIAKVQSGDTLGAYNDFKEAVRLKPSDGMMQDNLARIKLYLTVPEK